MVQDTHEIPVIMCTGGQPNNAVDIIALDP